MGLTCSNSTTSAITVDVALNDGSNDHFMIKGGTVPSGGSLLWLEEIKKLSWKLVTV